jgi:5-methyltetrahydropteroyltriglutamate--homocysteine methyltransferase
MRILTTHVGSLPRPDDLVALLRQHDAAGSAAEALAARARSAVDDAVRAQVAAGIDIVNDGEQGRTDYSTYIKDRLTGFEGEHADQVTGADLKEFPEFAARRRASVFRRPTCTGPSRGRISAPSSETSGGSRSPPAELAPTTSS